MNRTAERRHQRNERILARATPAAERRPKPRRVCAVAVRTYHRDAALERGLRSMIGEGYQVETQSVRKAAWSPLTGLLTRKQIRTSSSTRAAPTGGGSQSRARGFGIVGGAPVLRDAEVLVDALVAVDAREGRVN